MAKGVHFHLVMQRLYFIQLMTGYEGNIWIIGPQGKNVIWCRRPNPTISISGPTIHTLPKSQSMTVLLYSSLKIYDLNMPVTSSFVSYQMQLFLHSSSAISDLPNLDKNSNSFDVGLVDRSTLKLSDWL